MCVSASMTKINRITGQSPLYMNELLIRHGGVLTEGHILAGYYGFDANISFTFQAVKNLSAHPT